MRRSAWQAGITNDALVANCQDEDDILGHMEDVSDKKSANAKAFKEALDHLASKHAFSKQGGGAGDVKALLEFGASLTARTPQDPDHIQTVVEKFSRVLRRIEQTHTVFK